MPSLAVGNERKFLRYIGQQVDCVYRLGSKLYGKNLWRFPTNGGHTTAGSYGTWSINSISGDYEHHSITYTTAGNNASDALKAYIGIRTHPTYANRTYSFQIQVKSTLPTARLYVYIYGAANPVRNYLLSNLKADEFTTVTLEGLSSVGGQAASDTYLGSIYIGFSRGDYPAAFNLSYFLGHTIEVRAMKLEEGTLSPYSLNPTL